MKTSDHVEVRTVMLLRVSIPPQASALASVLACVRRAGGELRAHVLHEEDDARVLLLACRRPGPAALAIEGEGMTVRTETAVQVDMPVRPGAASFLLQTLEAERIAVTYSFAAAAGDRMLALLRTSDNPKAEDLLSAFLARVDRSTDELDDPSPLGP